LLFAVTHRDPTTRARAGLLHTPHGVVETPVFMPVGTAGTVKAISQEELEALGVRILLGNTYHLYLRPGHEVVRELGGLHRFMGWRGSILTDSGGYQIMSLEGLGRVSDDGYEFRSHLDGSRHVLSPELAVEIQIALGSDIMMSLDHCVEYPASREVTADAVRLTSRWARRCRNQLLSSSVRSSELQESFSVQGSEFGVATDSEQRAPNSTFNRSTPNSELRTPNWERRQPTTDNQQPALFGIVQGGIDPELRRESAEALVEIGFEGYSIGGLSVGEPKSATYELTEFTASLLPRDQPRYLMGVGTPKDLVECVAHGVDMFDCVMPTRHARNGSIFTSQGRIVIKNARYARDPSPLDPACSCAVCQRYSRAYLRHLFMAGEMLGPMLATRHNLHFYLDTIREIRDAIRSGEYNGYRSRVRSGPVAGEVQDS
jgi:queuine tRNA-ribosyltransferase